MVVLCQPGSAPLPCLLEGQELVMPRTFLFETAKESFDDSVLFRLGQPIISARLPKAAARKDQAVVAPQDGSRQRA